MTLAALSHLAAFAPTAASASRQALANGLNTSGGWLSWGYTVGGVSFTIGKLLGAMVLFIAFLLVAALLKRGLYRFGERNGHVNRSTLYTVERLLRYVVLGIGVLAALSMAGVPMSKMTVFAGALGVGLGFGLQAIFNNFVSGLILLFDRSLKVGDFVELASGVHGNVLEIRIRATLITTNDDIDILVPNSEFVTGRVVNWTLREVSRRQKIPFGVAYGTDKELVRKAALEAAAEVPFTLTMEGPRAPQVWLINFGDSSLDFQLVVWLNADATRRVGAVTAAYNWALLTALEKYGIEIPFPQRDLHVRSWKAPPSADERAVFGAPDATSGARGNDAARDVERSIAESSSGNDTTTPDNDRGATR